MSTLVLCLVACRDVRAGTLITFDTDADGNPLPPAPGLFASTTALRDLYAPLGIRFSGPGPLDGGAILNADASGFGQPALSGKNFLAFNQNAVLADGGIPQGPETILFDAPQLTVSFMLASSQFPASFDVDVYDENDQLLDTYFDTISSWKQILFKVDGIRKVMITRRAGSGAFVMEDVFFEERIIPSGSLPEPSSVVQFLTAAALGGAGLTWRRRAVFSASPARRPVVSSATSSECRC